MVERLTALKGPMFSEKTTTLVGRARRAGHADKFIEIFKPIIDDRYGGINKVVSHDQLEYPATPIKLAREILVRIKPETTFVGIDEAQFFDEEIINVVKILLDRDVEVVVAGLPLNFRGEPFGKMPELLAMADQVFNLSAICKYVDQNGVKCKKDATKTQRIIDGKPANYNDPEVMIGADESYEARCPDHFFVPGRPEPKIE